MAKKPPKPDRTQRLSNIFDRLIELCEDIVTARTPQTDDSGHIVLDENGKPYMTLPSAAHMREARMLLQQCNVSAVATPDGEDRLSRLKREAAERGMPALKWTGERDAG